MSEFLSICIPTYNRADYLRELLENLLRCLEYDDNAAGKIKIYVSDNNSVDETKSVCDYYAQLMPLSYGKNDRNIGGDRNILKCSATGDGIYRWVIGDDELLYDDSLQHIIMMLEKFKPSLMINLDNKYKHKLKLPGYFDTYRKMALHTIKRGNPHFLVAHSLISCNIFRTDSFDYRSAEQKIATYYGHMYGLICGLVNCEGEVFISKKPTIIIRENRAEMEYELDLLPYWVEYSNWLNKVLELGLSNTDVIFTYKPALHKKLYDKIILKYRAVLSHLRPVK
jgi:glycosyltransferase involved in cell wall biosynthesis